MRPRFLLSLALTFAAMPAPADVLIRRLMREGEVPGLSIVVIRGAKIASHANHGFANAATRAPIDDATIFEAASLAKPVFAYAVLKLVDAGMLSLDVPLHQYLPAEIDDERAKQITARMVLSHTTGFQNEVMPGQKLAIHFEPGSRFGYSGAGFLYLQRVVEHLTRKPLPALMRELVFTPLGMRDSGYVWIPSWETRKAHGHTPGGRVADRRKPNVATVATLHMTTRDYARFVIATSRAKLTPQTPISESLSWGLGWALEKTPRGTAFWHWGENNAEFHTFAMAYPDGEGVVIFTNSGNGFSIIPDIVSAILRGPHPAFAFMGYERYDSPAKQVLRDIRARGAEAVLATSATDALTEREINRIGYILLEQNRVADAVRVFERNVARFPASANVYDSLGEAYAAAGAKAKAIASYERSLALDPNNGNAREWIAKLR